MEYAIFDMDGLLIDSEPVWMAMQRSVMLDLHGMSLSESELLAFRGRSSRDFAESMARRFQDQGVDAGLLLEAMLSRMAGAIVEAPLMPGARELLDWLALRRVPTAIASSSPLPFIEAVVRQHALPIGVLASGTEVRRSKPHPAVFELAAERLGARPSQCRVWEDSINGVIAGLAAGMEVIAVPDPGDAGRPQFSTAHRVHRSLHQSLAELQQTEIRTH